MKTKESARVIKGGLNATESANYFYMRPSLGSTGQVPSVGSITSSPDIWLAGTQPIANAGAVLSTDEKYTEASPNDVFQGVDNYIYVRGKNGASGVQSPWIELYYAPNGVINWPIQWIENKLYTKFDQQGMPVEGSNFLKLGNVNSGDIAAGNDCFVWRNVPAPPSGSDHYCLFANINDANNSHPVPGASGIGKIDMANIVRNDLRLGWRNVHMVSGNKPSINVHSKLTIPNEPGAGGIYNIYLKCPSGFNGTEVAFHTNKTDAQGKQIELSRTKVQAGGEPSIYGCQVDLPEGFDGDVQINVWFNGVSVPEGQMITIEAGFIAATAEEHFLAERYNLYCDDYIGMVKSNTQNLRHFDNAIPIHRTVFIGSDHFQIHK